MDRKAMRSIVKQDRNLLVLYYREFMIKVRFVDAMCLEYWVN